MTEFSRALRHLDEPLLQFKYGQCLVYPRDGLYLFGPVGDPGDDISTVPYGVIGVSEGVRRFTSWADRVRGYIDIPAPGPRSRAVEPQHVPFPGFQEAFHAEWPAKARSTIADLDSAELERVLRIENRHEAIRSAVDMYVTRIIAENNRAENPPKMWFVVIPESVYQFGRPLSKVKKDERVAGTIALTERQARKLDPNAPTLFGIDEMEAQVYKYATHFRRQLKARLLKDQIVTQIVRETTLTPEEFVNEKGWPLRRVEDPATIAWKLCTGAFYKAGGRPWQLADVRPGVCYAGLVYKKSELTTNPKHSCCAAQMFLSNGEGVVFRGALGPWFHTDTKQFHLDKTAACNLITMVIGEYERIHGQPPAELFIHAKSAFDRAEWEGFEAACPAATKLVGVQIVDAHDDLKLFRSGEYPVARGTVLYAGQNSAFLWTSGYAPRLDTYMGPETPNPISVRVLRGDCDLNTVLNDVLGLTKINFNSCLHNDRLPVTIRFADAVGDVLVAAPMEGDPKLPFKFYI